ncbi:transporter substrate-binding domain-containing protein [Desulfonema magnum]|uniref:Solute-binding protein family 3 domain-containing protein, MltF-like n=1 Tax=Desulfonema magnum TaxID=45655 RepID=A0A975GRP7_9BACT|nr:transporter substrate-binding domain-containing protein [Desulfonema magnum]QTA91137.1 Solute-binding protein family 3 domain-containing protein, MltF-like [Desulfonema magnum]
MFKKIQLTNVKFKMVVIAFLCFCFVSECSHAETDTLVLATVNAPDTRIYQISEAVLGEAFKRNYLKLILKTYPPKRAEKLASLGKVDGDAHRIYLFNKDHPDLIRVSEPVQSIRQSVFTKTANFKVKGWKSLAPYKILYMRGIKFAEKGLKGVVKKENLIPVDSTESAFKMLSRGRGDVFITSPETGFRVIKKLSLENSGIKLLTPPLVVINLYTYLHKKHIKLVPKISDAIKEIKADGSYQKIIEKVNAF